MKKTALLVGGRSKAKSLAVSLLDNGYRVTVINDSQAECLKIAENDKLHVYFGDGTKPYVLEDADAGNADIVVAMTAKDEDNLVICELCKKRFGVEKAVALITDPKMTEFFYQMGVDRVVCAVSVITNIIEQQAFLDTMTTLVPIGEGRVQIAEVPIDGRSPVIGKRLADIRLPKEVIVGCILRGDTAMVPSGDTNILAGDMLILVAGGGQERKAIKELTGR